MRMKLNDIEVGKQGLHSQEQQHHHQQHPHQGGWISKIFGSSSSPAQPAAVASRSQGSFHSPIPVAKLAPALAASTTTVNVEFSGVGVRGHATTQNVPQSSSTPDGLNSSTLSSSPIGSDGLVRRVPPERVVSPSPGLRGIFAGSRNLALGTGEETWLVVPRSAGVSQVSNRPRVTNAAVPVETGSTEPLSIPQNTKTLRRGLSDSSIRTTATAHGQNLQQTSIQGLMSLFSSPPRGEMTVPTLPLPTPTSQIRGRSATGGIMTMMHSSFRDDRNGIHVVGRFGT